MKLPQNIHVEYEQVEIKDIYSGNLEGKLVAITGTPRNSYIESPNSDLRKFIGELYSGKDAINLETTLHEFNLNQGALAYGLAVTFQCDPITVGGRIKKSEDSPDRYVIVPHFLIVPHLISGFTKEGKENIIPFAPIGPAIIDIKKKQNEGEL